MVRALLIFLLLPSWMASQCSYSIYYAKGKFRMSDSSDALLPQEFFGFNGITGGSFKNDSALAPDTMDASIRKDGFTLMATGCNSILTFSNGSKWAVFDHKGAQLTPFKYDLAIPWVPANNSDIGWDSSFALVSLKGKWGLVSKKGKEVTKIVYDIPIVDRTARGAFYFYQPEEEQPACDIKSAKCKVHLLKNGEFSLPMIGPALILLRNGKYGGIDLSGTEVLPFDYEEIITSKVS